MKRASTILSFSALAHLTIIDLLFYLLSPEISVNILFILTYNLIWMVAAVLLVSGIYKEAGN